MNTEEAITVIKEACASVNGTLAVHTHIQSAISIIEQELAKKTDKK